MYSPGPYTYGCSVDHSLHTHETLISGPLFVASTLAHTHSTCAHTHREDSHLTLVIKSPLSATQPTVAVQGKRLVCQTTAPLAIEAEC